jgi:mono/diheme cytochrome c family protein
MRRRLPALVVAVALLPLLAALTAGCRELFPRRTAGETVYRRLCARCHGVDGAGNTPRYMGNSWADLTDDRWRHGGDDASIETVVRDGIFGEMPGNPELSRAEMQQLLAHLRKLQRYPGG